MNGHYPFVLPPLPCRYYVSEPYLGEQAIRTHHDTFFQGYADRSNTALQKYPRFQRRNLERLIVDDDRLLVEIRTTVYSNADGVHNHDAYFAAMMPRYHRPSNHICNVLEESFDSFGNSRKQILGAGLRVFGPGWAWLAQDRGTKLRIVITKNQDMPLPQGLVPLLPLNVWEHSYSLQYYSEHVAYIKNWFALIDWSYVEERYLNEHS